MVEHGNPDSGKVATCPEAHLAMDKIGSDELCKNPSAYIHHDMR